MCGQEQPVPEGLKLTGLLFPLFALKADGRGRFQPAKAGASPERAGNERCPCGKGARQEQSPLSPQPLEFPGWT